MYNVLNILSISLESECDEIHIKVSMDTLEKMREDNKQLKIIQINYSDYSVGYEIRINNARFIAGIRADEIENPR